MSGQSESRFVNPTSATLVPRCGSRSGRPLQLPLLKAGDRYSIFLVESHPKPLAVGNVDAMEADKN